MKSIGTVLAAQIVLVLFVIMTALGAWGIREQHNEYTDLMTEKEVNTLKPLALILGQLVFDLEDERIGNILQSYLETPDILAIKISETATPSYYFGKTLDTGAIVDFVKQQVSAPAYPNAITQTQALLYEQQPLGTLEIIFSRDFITKQERETVRGALWVFLIVTLVETVLILTLVNRRITMPLKALTQTAQQIADGNVDITIPPSSSQNEIGMLTAAFQKMSASITTMTVVARRIAVGDIEQAIQPRSAKDVLGHAFVEMSAYLQHIAKIAEEIAAGDLQHEIQPKTEHDVLGHAFLKMKYLRQSIREIMAGATELRRAAEHLKLISAQMVSSTHQASNQTPVISSNSMEISENAETVAVSTEEMSANVREISRGTEHVAQISKTAVEQATTAMNSISELDARSQEIGDIIKVITAISQQTNLLALNATIEAARAGDFGRGFAVVAHEIKELSRETAVSGESIIRKLETIRTGSSHAAEGIQAISKIIHEIHDISNAIASGIEEQAITTEDIAKRMAYVAKGSRDITVAMNDVTSIVQITTDNASRVQETGNTLFALADTLQRLVDQFKI